MPPRRPGRRQGTAGTVVGALGGLAGLCVVAVVSYTLAGPGGASTGGIAATMGTRPGSRQAALTGPLYRSGTLDPVACPLPAIHEDDDGSMRGFLDTLSDCLDEVWGRQFGKAGLRGFAPPRRVFWSVPGRSPCGSYPVPGTAAFYCPANDTVYAGLDHIVEAADDEPVSHYAVYARVVAHEYGHHVQEDAGILEYGHRLMAGVTGAASDEVSRRVELQAQCFAGAFLAATLPMTPGQYRAVLGDAWARGDDDDPDAPDSPDPPERRDHGSRRNYASWVARGYTRRVLAACNTWTASPSDVS